MTSEPIRDPLRDHLLTPQNVPSLSSATQGCSILLACGVGARKPSPCGIAGRQSKTAATHVRDVSFFEDHSRIRTKPGHFARFRSFALNVLRANGAADVSPSSASTPSTRITPWHTG